MIPKKIKILLYLIPIVVVTGCSNDPSSEETYQILKQKSFVSLTKSEKIEFKSLLSEKLRKDKNFKFIGEQQNLMAVQWMTRDKEHDNKQKMPHLVSPEQMVEYFRSRGIKNPKLYYKRYIVTLLASSLLKKSYPEFLSFDKASRREIFYACSPKLSKANISLIAKNRQK